MLRIRHLWEFFDDLVDGHGASAPTTLPNVTYTTQRFPYNHVGSSSPVNTGGTIPPTGAYSLLSGTLLTGIALDADTGILSGTATVIETQTVVIRVTNAGGSQDVTLNLATVVSDNNGPVKIIGLWRLGSWFTIGRRRKVK